jgi:hypothetical protein
MGRIKVHAVPGARCTEVVGMHGDAIRIRIAAPPVDGAANEELLRFLAELMGVPRRQVELAAGTSGRRKIIEVAGIETETIRQRLLTADH